MEILAIYLLYGDEEYLIRRDLDAFRRAFAGDNGDCRVERFDGRVTPLSAVLDSAAEMPLFGERRLLIVEHAPWFGPGAENAQALIDYAAAPNDETCLVFVADKIDKRLKTVKAIAKHGKVRCDEKIKSGELPAYVRRYVSSFGKTMSFAAIGLFLKLCAEDLALIVSELDKLILAAGEQPEIYESDVERLVSATAQANMFQLSDALGARDGLATMTICRQVLAEMPDREYPALQGYIANYLRLLLQVQELAAARMGQDAIAGELGVHRFRIQKALTAARNYRPDELESGLTALLETDFKVKSGQSSFADVFPAVLLSIAAKRE